MHDPISDFLDAAESEEAEDIIYPPMVVDRADLKANPHHESVVKNANEDYEFVRTNLKQIIETNVNALSGLAKLAQQSESPRAYEVLSSYLKQMTEANKSLMELHIDAKAINEESGTGNTPGAPTGGGDTNNFFVGSTEDLQQLLAGRTIKDIVPEED